MPKRYVYTADGDSLTFNDIVQKKISLHINFLVLHAASIFSQTGSPDMRHKFIRVQKSEFFVIAQQFLKLIDFVFYVNCVLLLLSEPNFEICNKVDSNILSHRFSCYL